MEGFDFILLFLINVIFILSFSIKTEQEIVTVPVNTAITVNCSNAFHESVLNITDIYTEHQETDCKGELCSITTVEKNEIKENCNGKRSCVLSANHFNSCLQDYGYFNLSYSCQELLPYTCDFEHGSCNWTVFSTSHYMWKMISGKTPSSQTGPDRDHTTSSDGGFYLYAEASSISPDSVAYLLSGLIIPSRVQCLTFWYHMYGEDINTLSVFQLVGTTWIEIWTTYGDKGKTWNYQILNLKQDIGLYQIVFKAIRGDGSKGDIALDDIFIANRQCYDSKQDCNFETNVCQWSQDLTSQYKWSLHSGQTTTPYTGPSHDHTTGSSTGTYIYLEATNIDRGTTSRLISETVYPSGPSCLIFWYHMYGSGMGTLKMFIRMQDRDEQLWYKSGNQRNQWIQALVDISTMDSYNIVFEGVRGRYRRSDIALDDIFFVTGPCADFQKAMSHLTLRHTGPINNLHTCVSVDDVIDIKNCSKHYIEFNQLTSDMEFDDCSDIYKNLNESTGNLCSNVDDSDFCSFNLSTLLPTNPECFVQNRLKVEYKCEDTSNNRNRSSASPISSNSQDLGIVGGVVGGLILLVIVVVALFIVYRRSRTSKKSSKAERGIFNTADNIAYHNNVYSGTDHQTEGVVQYCDLQAANNDNYLCDETTGHRVDDTSVDSEYTYIENNQNNNVKENVASNNEVNDQYSILNLPSDRPNGATEYLQGSLHSDDHTRINSDKAPCTSGMGLHNENQYAVCYPDVPLANTTVDAETNPPGNYAITDPKATGFNRSKDVPDDYELATPISSADAGNIEESEHPTGSAQDLYVTPEDGTYDSSSNIRYKNTDNSIYSHTVDSVYDTASHEIMADGNEDTYDHFFGKNNDNDDDMTKITY